MMRIMAKDKRRPKGSGSLGRQRDGTYRPELNGKKSGRRAKTKAEAEAILVEMRESQELGRASTVAESIEYHRTKRKAKIVKKTGQPLAPKTLMKDEWAYWSITECFGADTVWTDITAPACDAWLEDVAEGMYSKSKRLVGLDTVQDYAIVLNRMIKYQMRLLGKPNMFNPMADIEMPEISKETKERVILTDDQMSELYDKCNSERVRRLIMLSGVYGLRPSEARALQWGDVKDGTIHVKSQARGLTHTRTKTQGAYRTVPLLDDPISTVPESDEDYLLGTDRGEGSLEMMSSGGIRQDFSRALERAGLPYCRPYDLRHTAITRQCHAYTNPTHVATWAGTSLRMITEVYLKLANESSLLPDAQVMDLLQAKP